MKKTKFQMLLIICLLSVVYTGVGFAFEAEEKLPDPIQEGMARELFRQLRCVVCAGQSIAESDVSLARDLRMLVRERVAKGDSDKEVIKYMSELYGSEILFKPPLNTSTYVLWFGPFLFLLIGVIVIWLHMRNRNSNKE